MFGFLKVFLFIFTLHGQTEVVSLTSRNSSPISSIDIKALGSNRLGCKFLRKTVFIDRTPYSSAVPSHTFRTNTEDFQPETGVINYKMWANLLNPAHKGPIESITFDGIEIYSPLYRDMPVVSRYNDCLMDAQIDSIPLFVHQVVYLSVKLKEHPRPISVRWNNISQTFESQYTFIKNNNVHIHNSGHWEPLSKLSLFWLESALSHKKWTVWTSIHFRFNGAIVIGTSELLNPSHPVVSISVNGFDF